MTIFNPDKTFPRAIILRGVAGSGKSTIANIFKQCAGYYHIEADHYFYHYDTISRQRVYKFDATKLKEAHAWCLERTVYALKAGHRVVVANTFTRRWEMQPYLDAFASLGVTPTVLHAESAFKSLHDVPEETVAAQRARWEPLNGATSDK